MRLPVVACLLLASPALAETNIWGVPGECQLSVVECATERDPAKRPAPKVLSSVFMRDLWTTRAFEASPDGETLLVMLEDGLRVVRGGRTDDYPLDQGGGVREYAWHPDSSRVATWVRDAPPDQQRPRRAAVVLDVSRLPPAPLPAGAKVPYEVVDWSSETRSPFGLLWAPDGESLLVLATETDPTNATSGVLRRVPVAGQGAAHDLLRVPGALDFAYGLRGSVVPVGSGRLLLGQLGVLYALSDGGLQPVADLPSTGLHNLAWSPDRGRNHVLLLYKRAVKSRTGEVFRGAYLLDLEAALAGGQAPTEQLDDVTSIHTLAISSRGTYATWAEPRYARLRPLSGRPTDTVEIRVPALPSGEELPVKGFAWSPDETKLAITAGNRLYVHELGTKELYLVAELGALEHTFLAQPTWIGDRVVVGAYEDTQASGRQRPGQPPQPDDAEPWGIGPPKEGR